MLRTRIRFANRFVLIAGALIALVGAAALLPGCTEPLTLYHVPGAETFLAQGGKVLILPFMDTRTQVGKEDRGDIGNHTRALFVEALREFNADKVLEIMTPKMPRRTRSLTNAQVAELGRQYGADLVVAGQVFSFVGTRAASIPPRAGMFVRVINAHDGALLFVGDHYQAASFPGAEGGRDLQALYVSARLIEGFLSKLQPAFIAAGEIAPLGALAMLSPQPEKKGLLGRLFKPKQAAAAPKRKLFAWRNSPEPPLEFGSLLGRELQVGRREVFDAGSEPRAGSGNRKNNENNGKGARKKREPGNVVETERYLGMTASFLFNPEQWDDQFIPEVPPLIDFDENFYQLPAPPPGSAPEPLPVPPSFLDETADGAASSENTGIGGESLRAAVAATNTENAGNRGTGQSASRISNSDETKRTVASQPNHLQQEQPEFNPEAPGVDLTSGNVVVAAGSSRTTNATLNEVASMAETASRSGSEAAPQRLHAPNAERSGTNAPESLRQASTGKTETASVHRDVVVDSSSAQVIDELPEIDMSKVYPNSMPADAPYPVPAPSAKISGDELASDLFDAGGEPWQSASVGMASGFGDGSSAFGTHPEGMIYSEPIAMPSFGHFGAQAGVPSLPFSRQMSPGAFVPDGTGAGPSSSDAVIIPHTLTMADIGQPGQGAIGVGSFQLDPDTLEIIAITLPAIPGTTPSQPQTSVQIPASPLHMMTPVMTAPAPQMPFTGQRAPTTPGASEMRGMSYAMPGTSGMPYADLLNPASHYVGYSAPVMATAPVVFTPATTGFAVQPVQTGFGVDYAASSRTEASFAARDVNGFVVNPGYENKRYDAAHASETAAVIVPAPRKAPLAKAARPASSASRSSSAFSSKAQDASAPFVADNSGSSSAARAKPMAKRPPSRRRGRSESVKGEMVESRASVLARAAAEASMEGPLLGGRIVSEQPRTVKTIDNVLAADPSAVMQDPVALVAMPRFGAGGGIRVLMLPYHERDNPNNLIYNHGGGEVITTLFGIQLASDPGLNLMWDATGKATHNRLVSREEALEMGRQAGADYVVRGQVVEFRRAQSVPSFYSAIISTAVLAAQLFFAEMSGVDIATEMYRVSDGMCVVSRRDRSQQKYVVQAEKTIRRMAQNMASDAAAVLRTPHQEPRDPLIDILGPVSIMSDPDR